jgi:hypothetical protein
LDVFVSGILCFSFFSSSSFFFFEGFSLPVERDEKQFRGEKMKREDVEQLEPVEKKGDRQEW